MIDVIDDVESEKRWTAWKLNGARLEAIRAGRMRKVFMAVGVATAAWLIWLA